MDTKGFNERFKMCRRREGLSRRDLARRVGCSLQQISKIEEGRITRPRNLDALAAEMNTTPIFLLYGLRELETLDEEVLHLAIEIAKLTREEREHVRAIVRSFLKHRNPPLRNPTLRHA